MVVPEPTSMYRRNLQLCMSVTLPQAARLQGVALRCAVCRFMSVQYTCTLTCTPLYSVLLLCGLQIYGTHV